ncbi:sulfatase-like hydrolase/transferase [Roseiconus nitratireducens]|uniref:Sulfatase-like hydrolase/transferase n=1 Tax=Roseiconus nitratireducens TaxID=2605748 RepID=A0A5M6DLD3_9BACT|nr:sulfatase-like hydrolase/transferase [Roseiconus nitratireducens]KAA5547029.1 sulfatase-like hydrolase/transferase [Roseiconus nitratireducens]
MKSVVIWTGFLALLYSAAGAGACSAADSPRSQPNVLVIVTDDQAPWAFGQAVRRGRYREVPAAATPNLDRLAAEGATLDNCFCTTPVCSPARAALMTGRYASEFGIQDFIPQPGHKLYDPSSPVALPPEQSVTFAEVLQEHGYRTGLVGKWHLGDWTAPGRAGYHPTRHGFDYFMGLTGGGTTPKDPVLEENGQTRPFEGLTTDLLTDRAIGFIQRNADKPFLLCFHTRAPHAAWLPVAPEDWEPYATLDPQIPEYPGLDVAMVKRKMREYLASTSGVDRNLGRLLDELDRLSLAQRTVVIFTSDHGYNMGHHGIWHKGNGIWATKRRPPGQMHRGTKVISDKYRPNLYDLSLRVPAVIRWPDVIRAGSRIDATVTSLDLFPTILAMAGVETDWPEGLRGRSLLPLLRGRVPEDWDQDLYAEYSMINYCVATMRCYRTPRYKLIRDFHQAGRDEFYDLQSDPEELENLIDTQDPAVQATISRLHGKLMQRMRSLADPLYDQLTFEESP